MFTCVINVLEHCDTSQTPKVVSDTPIDKKWNFHPATITVACRMSDVWMFFFSDKPQVKQKDLECSIEHISQCVHMHATCTTVHMLHWLIPS